MSGVHHQPDGPAFDIVLILHVGCVVVGLTTLVASAATAGRLRTLLRTAARLPRGGRAVLPPGGELGRPHHLRHPASSASSSWPSATAPTRSATGGSWAGSPSSWGWSCWPRACCGRRSAGSRFRWSRAAGRRAGGGVGPARRHGHGVRRPRGPRPAGGRFGPHGGAALTSPLRGGEAHAGGLLDERAGLRRGARPRPAREAGRRAGRPSPPSRCSARRRGGAGAPGPTVRPARPIRARTVSASRARSHEARAGLVPPVETATVTGPSRCTDGRMNEQCATSSALFTHTPAASASA